MTARFLSALIVLAVLSGAAACLDKPAPPATGAPGADTPAAPPAAGQPQGATEAQLPRKQGSLRFAVIGDTGRGDRHQFETAAKMTEWRQWFDYSFVLMLGDNIYAEGSKEDYEQRFERPYKALLDAGVTFHAAIGNHDPVGQEHYPLFNMNGRRYYTLEKEEGTFLPIIKHKVLFVAIDTVNLTRQQVRWVDSQLEESDADWKIAFFHHPLYTSGRYQFWASRLRSTLEPVFTKHKVAVALSGHEHFYERITPQKGVQYFTSGAGGALRLNDLRTSGWTAAGFDTDTHFMLMEISGDTLYFVAVSRKGQIVDSGTVSKPD